MLSTWWKKLMRRYIYKLYIYIYIYIYYIRILSNLLPPQTVGQAFDTNRSQEKNENVRTLLRMRITLTTT